ncbi:mitochondrial potassium channel-like [Lytechinus variegatus]|uniref:mitochondrial potassium channel-like n=1 Tax=Lytechinus variegatus TaxID=7654 RepID=UPI001BB2A19D|nr:mitochondrial potassium channel-like [Lytechinus variegatus]
MSRQFDFRKFTLIRMKLREIHTGNERVDKVVHALTNGRAASAMTAYEQIIGIGDVKAAQNRVTEVEKEFLKVREEVAEAGREVSGLQTKLHSLRGKLDRTPRDDPKFLELATEEHSMLQAETRLKEKFQKVEARERDTFSHLSNAVRESHEKQRAQEERTKYWSVIGSVIGTLIGIIGSSIVNQKRMHELRTLVSELSAGDLGSGSSRQELAAIVQQLKESLGQGSDAMQHPDVKNSMNHTLERHDELLSQQLKAIEKLMDERNRKLSDQIKGMRRMTDVGLVSDTGTFEELLSDTEQKLEWEMKMSTLSTVVFIYGAFALTLPILYSIFK